MHFQTVFCINYLLQVDNEHIIKSMKNEIHELINKLNENEKQDLRSKLNASLNENAQHYELLKKNKVSLTDAFSHSFFYN